MRIAVTEADIANGCRLQATSCPVALALTRSLAALGCDPEDEVHVCWGTKQIQIGDAVIPMPDEVQDFAGRFDDGQEVEPFVFELELWP